MQNHRRLLEAYLTHSQPEQRAELLKEGMLQSWLDDQTQAMRSARQTILEELSRKRPEMSQLQREMEADQMVRELFLTPN